MSRTIFALRRGPIRYSRDQTIAIESEASDYIFLVISGVTRSFRSFQNGTRSIVAFYLPTEFSGLTTHPTHLLTAEAAADANILFFKRSALFSMAGSESRIAKFLLTATLTELRRTQEHSLLISRDAKCRVASFLIDLSKRTRTAEPGDHSNGNFRFDRARAVVSRPDIERPPRTCAHDELTGSVPT